MRSTKLITIVVSYLALISLSACVSGGVEIPDCEVKESVVDIQQPLKLPELPEDPEDITLDTLVRYIVVSGGNYDIAMDNAGALVAQSGAYNDLRDCSEFQRKFSEVREEQLEQEKQDHFIDNLWHRGLIVLIGVGVAL